MGYLASQVSPQPDGDRMDKWYEKTYVGRKDDISWCTDHSWGTWVIDPTRGREMNLWPQVSGRTLVSLSPIMPQFNSHVLVEEEKYRYGECVFLT